jgi:hypothetical protein
MRIIVMWPSPSTSSWRKPGMSLGISARRCVAQTSRQLSVSNFEAPGVKRTGCGGREVLRTGPEDRGGAAGVGRGKVELRAVRAQARQDVQRRRREHARHGGLVRLEARQDGVRKVQHGGAAGHLRAGGNSRLVGAAALTVPPRSRRRGSRWRRRGWCPHLAGVRVCVQPHGGLLRVRPGRRVRDYIAKSTGAVFQWRGSRVPKVKSGSNRSRRTGG